MMLHDILVTVGWSSLAVLSFMLLAYGYSMAIKRLDVVDVAWGLGFIVAAFTSLFVGASAGYRGLLLTTLVTVWGLRLALHIGRRRLGRPEDKRYVAMRQQWKGNPAVQALLRIFLIQGLLMLIIATPVMIANTTSLTALSWLDYLGVAVWIVGYMFEAVGDRQLSRFMRNPANKGKLMTSGLWKYTRHPNYFGEVTQWWGIFLIALSVSYGWLGVVGPLTITLLILKVSGVPMLEKSFAKRPGWEDYKSRTSKFFPLPPRT